MWGLLAQAAETAAVNDWVPVGGSAAGILFVIWYARHITTKTIPDIINTHADTVKSLVAEFRAETKEQREIERERFVIFTQSITGITAAVEELRDAIKEAA